MRVVVLDPDAQAHLATGRQVPNRDVWETWVPGTRLVVWYRFTDTELQVIHIWHSAQDRHLP